MRNSGRFGFTFLVLISFASTVTADDAITAKVGKREIVFPDKYMGLRSFPDERLSMINDNPATFLMVTSDGTVLMRSATTFEKAVPVKVVLAPGSKGEFDDGYAGIGGIHKVKGQIWGFYHAERFLAGMPNPNAIIHWSVALAVSSDGGQTFEKKGQILTYGSPRTTGRNIEGCGDIAVCPDPTGTYLYGYYTEASKNERGVVICMARSKISDGCGPGTWQKYYNGDFTEPGLGGEDSPVVPFPLPETTSTHNPHVTYIKSFKKYVMVLDSCIWPDHEKNPPPKDGTYFCYSDDGINWSKPKPLFVGNVTIPVVDRDYSAHPGLYIQKENGNKATGWLINAYSPKWGGDRPDRQMHHMARRSIVLTLADVPHDDVLKKKLGGTKWINTNKVSFEWTADGRFLHNGKEREWKVLDGNRVQIVFSPDHKDTLEFDEDLTKFKQWIRGGPSSFEGKRSDK